MVPWTFTLDSAHGLADFIEYHAVFLPTGHLHASYHHLDEHEVESLGDEGLLSLARQVGRDTWAARQTLRAYIEGEGVQKEWEWILASVRPSTAILLARLLRQEEARPLHHFFRRPETRLALHDYEEEEIQLVRPEVWLSIWKDHRHTFLESQRMFEKEQLFFEQRLQEEREVLLREQDRQLAAERTLFLQEMEDRVFLRGERVDIGAMQGVA